MKKQPLSVAIAAVINDGKILLIKRLRGDYTGLLALPGGKIEVEEHINIAAIREIEEETGIKTVFEKHLGIVSEHLIEKKSNQTLIDKHLILHLCQLRPISTNIIIKNEGESAWYDLKNLSKLETQIIPSDFLMIKKMVLTSSQFYYNCVLEKQGDQYLLKRFD